MKKIVTSMLLMVACSYVHAQKVQVLDRCESLGEQTSKWFSHGAVPKLSEDHKEGSFSISTNGYQPERLRKIYAQPFDSGVTRDGGYMAFSIFVEKPELLNGNGQVAISSSAAASKDSFGYGFNGLKLGSTKLVAGWNDVIVPLSSFKDVRENPNLSAINYFRIILYNQKDDTTSQELKIDNIRFAGDKALLEKTVK